VRCVRSSRAGLKQRFCFCFMFSQRAAPDDPWRELAAAHELLLVETPLRTLHPRRIQHGIPLGISLILVFSSSLANVNAIRSTAFAIAPAATATRHKRPLSRSCCQHKE